MVPKQLQAETLQKIHTDHQGIVQCRLRAVTSVWWPGISKEVEAFVQKYPECMKSAPNPREPLLSTPLPKHPWERVAADLFQLNGLNYSVPVNCRLLLKISRSNQTQLYHFQDSDFHSQIYFLSPWCSFSANE